MLSSSIRIGFPIRKDSAIQSPSGMSTVVEFTCALETMSVIGSVGSHPAGSTTLSSKSPRLFETLTPIPSAKSPVAQTPSAILT